MGVGDFTDLSVIFLRKDKNPPVRDFTIISAELPIMTKLNNVFEKIHDDETKQMLTASLAMKKRISDSLKPKPRSSKK